MNSETFGEGAMEDIRVKGFAAYYFPGSPRPAYRALRTR